MILQKKDSLLLQKCPYESQKIVIFLRRLVFITTLLYRKWYKAKQPNKMNKQNEPHNEKGGGGNSRALQRQSSSTGTVADRSCRIKHGADIANRIRKIEGATMCWLPDLRGKRKEQQTDVQQSVKECFESKSSIFIFNFQGYLLY